MASENDNKPRRTGTKFGLAYRIAVAMVALAIVTAAGVGLYAYGNLERAALPAELGRLDTHAHRLGDQIEGYVEDARAELLGLLGAPALQGYVRARANGDVDPFTSVPAEVWRQRIESDFRARLERRRSLDQLRLISAAEPGMELVRVDRLGTAGSVRVTPDDELQPKSRRPYFAATTGLGPGTVYVSEIDLNREFGQLDPRHVPELRIATPVRDPRGDVFAIVVANIDMAPALQRVRQNVLPGGRVYLLKHNGSFLIHPDRNSEFAASLGRQPVDPPRWLADLVAQPVPRVVETDSGSRVGAAVVSLRPAGGPPLTLLETLPYAALIGQIATLGRSTLAIMVAGALAAAIGAMLLARSLTRPLLQITRAVNLEAERVSHDLDLISASRGGTESTEPWSGLTELSAPPGETQAVPMDAAGEIGELARAFEAMRDDIRDKRQALVKEMAERREAELRFRLAVEACPSGMIIVDDEGRVTLANQQTCRMFGWERDELIGRRVEDLVPPHQRDPHRALRQSYLETPAPRLMGEGRELFGLRRDGAEFPVEIALNPIQTGGGTQVLGVIADITDRKAAEALLRARQQELERSNAELEQFAYVASHDLQEPLRMVASYAELLSERYQGRLDERADKYIHYAVDGARRMQRLVNDLLQYSRIGTQGREPAPTDSGQVLTQVLTSMRDSIRESGVRICHDDLPVVEADDGQLARVFQNLIGNAVKFRSAEDPQVRIGCERRGDEWLFSVADNGIGIDIEQSERVFQMFQRLHGRGEYDGSGIGLPIVRKIVERHGGRVWFESEPGQGTTFYFTLQANGDD